MSLFPSANDFKAGHGVEKDAPRKTGLGRFFELVGRDMSGMFLANLLTCLGLMGMESSSSLSLASKSCVCLCPSSAWCISAF